MQLELATHASRHCCCVSADKYHQALYECVLGYTIQRGEQLTLGVDLVELSMVSLSSEPNQQTDRQISTVLLANILAPCRFNHFLHFSDPVEESVVFYDPQLLAQGRRVIATNRAAASLPPPQKKNLTNTILAAIILRYA